MDMMFQGEERFLQSRIPRPRNYGYASSKPQPPDYSHLLPGGGGGGAVAPSVAGAQPNRFQFENANTAATNADFAANAPPLTAAYYNKVRASNAIAATATPYVAPPAGAPATPAAPAPAQQRIALGPPAPSSPAAPSSPPLTAYNTTPGTLSVTLGKGQQPAETRPGDSVTPNSNGTTTVDRPGAMPLQSAEDEAATGMARRNAYINNQQRKADYLYPGMDTQQFNRDANTRANDASAAGVAEAGNDQKRFESERKDFTTQLAARDKALAEERASHAQSLNELRARLTALESERKARQGADRQESTDEYRKTDEQRKTDQGNRRLDQSQQRIDDAKNKPKKGVAGLIDEISGKPTTQPGANPLIPAGAKTQQLNAGKPLPSPEQIQSILKEANNDPDKAAQIATQRGFRVTR